MEKRFSLKTCPSCVSRWEPHLQTRTTTLSCSSQENRNQKNNRCSIKQVLVGVAVLNENRFAVLVENWFYGTALRLYPNNQVPFKWFQAFLETCARSYSYSPLSVYCVCVRHANENSSASLPSPSFLSSFLTDPTPRPWMPNAQPKTETINRWVSGASKQAGF